MKIKLDDTAWMEAGLCRKLTQEQKNHWFFPDRGESPEPAKTICSQCPVKHECLDYAMHNVERWGIWGGTSERTRRELRKTYMLTRHCRQCGGEMLQTAASRRTLCSHECEVAERTLRQWLARDHPADNLKCVNCGAAAPPPFGNRQPTCGSYCFRVVEKLKRRPPIDWGDDMDETG